MLDHSERSYYGGISVERQAEVWDEMALDMRTDDVRSSGAFA